MSNNFPQNPKSFGYDEDAYNNLRIYFPQDKFVISKPSTVFGSREFGVDWIIEITKNKGNKIFNTGVSFFVQSKVIEKSKKVKPTVKIDMKNVEYLKNKNEPVFIHVLDKLTNVSYLIDFSLWLVDNFSPQWSSQKTVMIGMLDEFILSSELVDKILNEIYSQHDKNQARRFIDLYNRKNPSFQFYEPQFDQNNIYISPKNTNKPQKISITVNELGEKAIQKTIEEGYSTSFRLIASDIPHPLEPVYPKEDDNWLTLIPYVPSIEIVLDVTFLDTENNVLIQNKQVLFKCIRLGQKESEFEGKLELLILRISFSHTSSDYMETLKSLTFSSESRDIIALKKIVDFKSILQKTKTLILENPDKKQIFQLRPIEFESISNIVDRIINACYNLNVSHNLNVPLPEKFNDETLWLYEMTNQLLSEGKSFWVIKNNIDNLKMSKKDIQKAINIFLREKHLQISTSAGSEIKVSLSGYEIDLGEIKTVIYVSDIKNLRILQTALEQTQNLEEFLEIEVEINWEKSFSITQKIMPKV